LLSLCVVGLNPFMPAPASTAQHPLRARRVTFLQPFFHFELVRVKLESVLVRTPSVLKLSSGDDERESLFRCETPVVERSATACANVAVASPFSPFVSSAPPHECTQAATQQPRRRHLFLRSRLPSPRAPTIAAASPSPPLDSSAPPPQYIFPRFRVLFVFYAHRNSKRAGGCS
jgi:hypothetical protein